MKAALEIGRWVFLAPIGYVNAPRSMGTSLLQDPEQAPIIRKAFEDYSTGRFSKQQILERVNAAGLRTRRNQPLTSQAIGTLLRNQLYAGIIDVPQYGGRDERGDFEPLITEDLFHRAHRRVVSRIATTAPRLQAHPDFPLRNFVRCTQRAQTLEALQRVDAGERPADIHREMTARGLLVVERTKRRTGEVVRGPMNIKTFHDMLRREALIGRRTLPDGTTVKGQWKAVVPADLFARVQKRLAADEAHQQAVSTSTPDPATGKRPCLRDNPAAPLKHVLVCAECGSGFTWALQGPTNKRKSHYKCGGCGYSLNANPVPPCPPHWP